MLILMAICQVIVLRVPKPASKAVTVDVKRSKDLVIASVGSVKM